MPRQQCRSNGGKPKKQLVQYCSAHLVAGYSLCCQRQPNHTTALTEQSTRPKISSLPGNTYLGVKHVCPGLVEKPGGDKLRCALGKARVSGSRYSDERRTTTHTRQKSGGTDHRPLFCKRSKHFVTTHSYLNYLMTTSLAGLHTFAEPLMQDSEIHGRFAYISRTSDARELHMAGFHTPSEPETRGAI